MKNLLTLVALGAILSGCVADDPDLGIAEAAIGESTCETAPKDQNDTFVAALSCAAGPGEWADSNMTTYGSSGCPHQFLVGYGSQPTGWADVTRGWAKWDGALPTTQAECERSRLSVSLFLQEKVTLDWTVASNTYPGIWNGSSCSFVDGQAWGSAELASPPQGVLKSRVAVSAFTLPPICTLPCDNKTYHRVSASLVMMQC